MQILRLNLIPPRKQKRIRDLATFVFLKHTIEVLLLAAAASSIALLLGLSVLEVHFNNLALSFIAVNPKTAELNREAQRINVRVSQMIAAQEQFVPWSMILSAITELTPKAIYWNSWVFDKENGQATLVGVADNREALTALEEALKAKPWVAEVAIPLSDIVSAKDKPFTVTLIMTLKKLGF